MGGHGILEHLLEVIGIVVIEEPAAHQEAGVVINDHDAVDPPALAVLRDIRQVTSISLPHLPEGVLLKRFPVPHVRVPGRFEVMVPDEALDGADADHGRDECRLHKVLMDLGGVQPRERLLEAADLLDGCVEYSCAMKSHFRKSGNQMTGRRKSSNARLLAQCFI